MGLVYTSESVNEICNAPSKIKITCNIEARQCFVIRYRILLLILYSFAMRKITHNSENKWLFFRVHFLMLVRGSRLVLCFFFRRCYNFIMG